MKKNITSFLFFICLLNMSAQETEKVIINDTLSVNTKLLYSYNFSRDLSKWIVQFEQDESSAEIINGKMNVDSKKSCTVWFDKKLEGPLVIEYDAIVIDKGGNMIGCLI